MSLEHPAVPESKEVLKKQNKLYVKGTLDSTERLSKPKELS